MADAQPNCALPVVQGVEFREVPGYPGYAVGDDGSIWGMRSRHGPLPWRKLSPHKKRGGYRRIYLYRDAKRSIPRLSCLILEAFVGPRPPGMQCCHNDGNTSNDRLSNLRWGTPKDNAGDRRQHGRDTVGEKNGQSRLTEKQVREIRSLYGDGIAINEIARRFAIKHETARMIIRRIRWKHIA